MRGTLQRLQKISLSLRSCLSKVIIGTRNVHRVLERFRSFGYAGALCGVNITVVSTQLATNCTKPDVEEMK